MASSAGGGRQVFLTEARRKYISDSRTGKRTMSRKHGHTTKGSDRVGKWVHSLREDSGHTRG